MGPHGDTSSNSSNIMNQADPMYRGRDPKNRGNSGMRGAGGGGAGPRQGFDG